MDITIRLWLNPVCHDGDWDGTRPRKKKQAEEKKAPPLTAGVLLCAQSLKAFHIESNEAYGPGSVAIEPGYKVAIKVGNSSFPAIRTTSNTTSTPRAKRSRSP